VVRAVLVVLVVVAVLIAMAWFFQRRLIYLPLPGPVPPSASVIDGAQDVTLHTSDGLELGAWLVPARGRDRGMTVLVANGNAGNRLLRAPLAEALADEGLSVLLFDYRGYGGNAGTPAEKELALDVRAAHRFLTEEAGVPPHRLIYYGESLGAAVVTELAAAVPPAGMVLRSPFTDLGSVGRIHYPFLPVRTLLRDRYPLVTYLPKVPCPVTVVYGTRDVIIPPEQSLAAAQALRGARVVAVEGADHNDLALLNGPELIAAVLSIAELSEGG
jgi:uncharacterized protein